MYLFGHFDVLTDNMAVVHLRTKPTLTKREARWVELLADFNFTVHHKPGRDNAAADALSRRPDLQPGESSVVQTELTAAQCNALEFALAIDDQFSKTVVEAYQHDAELWPIIQTMRRSPSDNVHQAYLWDGDAHHLYLPSSPSNRLCVPKCALQQQLLQEHHDCIASGHPGRNRTYFQLARHFCWPRMGLDVKKFVKSCDVCQRAKGAQLKGN